MHDRGPRIAGRETGEEVRARAGEGVDGLRRVTDDTQVGALTEPLQEQRVLQRADVLELVDDEMAILPSDRARDVVPLPKDPQQHQQDVLEVHDTALGLDLLVRAHDARHRRVVEPSGRVTARRSRGRGIPLGSDECDLGPLDLGGEIAQGGPIDVQPQPAERFGQGARLVRHHLGRRSPDRLRPEVVQLPQCRRVEGAGLHACHAQAAQPGAHLARGPRGEGEGKHPLGLVHTGAHGIRHPMGDRPSLARPGPGKDHHGAGR